MIEYRGEKFSGYNKPKRTPDHPKKSHVVLAKENGSIKLIRFGQQGPDRCIPLAHRKDAGFTAKIGKK